MTTIESEQRAVAPTRWGPATAREQVDEQDRPPRRTDRAPAEPRQPPHDRLILRTATRESELARRARALLAEPSR
jgi:hypothetical protein